MKKFNLFPPIVNKRSNRGWENIGKLTKRALRDLGGIKELKNKEVKRLCSKLFCEDWQKHVKFINMREDKLILKVANPYLRQELFFKKKEIIDKLNSALREELIKELILV